MKVLVDNTFASPALQQPLALGADIVLHSTTKYIGGHSDVVGGALLTNDEELDDAFAFLQNGAGAVPGPFDAYLTMRGLKTLSLRMQRHSENAAPGRRVPRRAPGRRHGALPGPAQPPQPRRRGAADVAASAAWCRCGCKGGRDAAHQLCARTEIFILAESLGGVESLIEHPGAMTHASTAGSQLEVPDDLVRLSVGIEDVADLLGDLEQALRKGLSAPPTRDREVDLGQRRRVLVDPTAAGDFGGAGVHPAPPAVVEAQQRAEPVGGVQHGDDGRRRRRGRTTVEQRRQQIGAGRGRPARDGSAATRTG